MRTNIRERRMKLFRRGNNRCPICLSPFSQRAVRDGNSVTLEHVPPTSFKKKYGLRSRGLCLTCSSCNNTAGREMDQVALHALGAPKGYVKIGDVSCNVELSLPEVKGDPIKIKARSMSGPIDHITPRTRDLTLRFRIPNQRYVDAIWLKSAYLSVFSLLGVQGYRYAQGEAICRIREHILNPAKGIIKNIPFGQAKGPDSGDWIFMNFRDARPNWLVNFGKYSVLLPPSWDTTFFDDGKFRNGNELTLSNGWFFDRTVFGNNVVRSVSVTDKAALEEAFGDRPFGGDVRIAANGKTQYYVLADYDQKDLTLLPVQPPGE